MSTWTVGEMAIPAFRRRRGMVVGLYRFLRIKPLGAVGAVVIVAAIFAAFLAPVISPYDPIAQDYKSTFVAPGRAHLFGTDELGRDILSRILWGARVALGVGLGSVLVGTSGGAVLGLISGYFGGKADLAIQRVMDSLMAFPMMVLAIAIVAAFGPSMTNVILAIATPLIPSAARVIRSNVLSIRELQYVDAARIIGCSHWRLLFLHILPNTLAPYIILVTTAIATAILTEASLSFLGLGTPPPEPSWGGMLSGSGRRYAQTAPWMAIFPGLAITAVVFGFNLFGDALRDVWDPRLRRG